MLISLILIVANQGDNAIELSTITPPDAGDQLILSNCQYRELQTVKVVQRVEENHYRIAFVTPLEHSYQPKDFVGPWRHRYFFIADTKRHNEQGYPIYALNTLDENGHSSELVEGVSGMRIFYRLYQPWETNALSMQRMNAEEVEKLKAWNQVAIVDIDLLLDSVDVVPGQQVDYTFDDGISLDKGDRRFYHPWHSTIALKGRCLICNAGLS